MSTYSASISVSNGNLSVTRPLDGGAAVDSVVDDLIYAVRNSDGLSGVGVTITTTDTASPAAQADKPPAPGKVADGKAADPLASSSTAG